MIYMFLVFIFFTLFAKGIDLIFRYKLSVATNLMAIVTYFIALILSFLLADFSIKESSDIYILKVFNKYIDNLSPLYVFVFRSDFYE